MPVRTDRGIRGAGKLARYEEKNTQAQITVFHQFTGICANSGPRVLSLYSQMFSNQIQLLMHATCHLCATLIPKGLEIRSDGEIARLFRK